MDKHYDSFFDETYYTETLDNGLKVVVFHKPLFNTTACAFGTPYGALKINQKIKNKEYHFHPGIAHFLEHKLFESQGDDMMNLFSSYGANVNAFTSYKETVYYFTKTGEGIEECLNLLLDFVQDLHITDKSVEKEKGIIYQEVSMYEQNPDSRLINETYKSLYRNNPIKFDIGGDKESVYAISKKELEECYKLNYHPSNMLLCITTFIDPNIIIKIVKDNQSKKHFKKFNKIESANLQEPNKPVKTRHTFKMPINTNKHLLAIKVNENFKDEYDAFKTEWCYRFLFEVHFSPINKKYQKWLDDKIINDFFGYEIDFDLNCAYMMFYIENNDETVLKKLVEESLKEKIINEEILTQIKRRNIGIMFNSFSDVEAFTLGYTRDKLEGLDVFKEFEILNNITLEDVENCQKKLSFAQSSYISMIKK